MRSALLTVAACLVGCAGPDDVTPSTDLTTFPTPPPVVVDTGWPAGDIGHLMLSHHTLPNTTKIYGVAAESVSGFINLAECAIEGTPCVLGFPDEDDWVDLTNSPDLQRDTITSRFLGYELRYGSFYMPYWEDPSTGFGGYAANISGEELPEGWIGVGWEGQWPEYQGTQDLWISSPIELTTPEPDSHVLFHNGEFVPIEWVPTGEGIVTLTVSARFVFDRLYRLEDDGYFELDVDALGITDDQEDLTFTLTRWNERELQKFGHVMKLTATSDTSFTAEYFNIGNRDFLYAADQCGEALGLSSLQAGGWWGSMRNFDDDLAVFSPCLGLGGASGDEGIYRVEVPPKYAFTVDYNVYDESGSVYLVSDCTDPVNTCITGADYAAYANEHEYLDYFNETDDTRGMYLVVDSTVPSRSIYTLDVTLQPLLPPEMVDTCAEAQAAYPAFPGDYYAEFTAYTGDLNPGLGGCTGRSTPGPESMMPIEVGAGQTLTINVDMPGADPAIYLLRNCNDAFSCPVGADEPLSPHEDLAYTNVGAAPELLYIVIDSQDGLQPYRMSAFVD